jgi:hypothetical protein
MTRRFGFALAGFALGLFGIGGCQEVPKRPAIRAPKEDFHTPPNGLFKDQIEYPKDLLNNVSPRRKKDDDLMPQPTGPIGGAMGAMPQ